jgi:hypothetical protein
MASGALTRLQMYKLKPGTKQDLERQWRLPDRIFFGYGACHILAHAFLERFPTAGFGAIWIRPAPTYRGNHVVVTDGKVAFDFHGYSCYERLISHHFRQYQAEYPGWAADLVHVRDNLANSRAMTAIGMNVRGPEQYLHNALPRANRFLDRYGKKHAIYAGT